MRIRKRTQSVATTTPPPQSISFKYHSGFSPPPSSTSLDRFSGDCSNMQAKAVENPQYHHARRVEPPRFGATAEPPVLDTLRLSDAHVKDDDDDGDLPSLRPENVDDADAAVKVRWRQSSPKKRKIERESSLLFEGSASMTAAELLVVNELANGVRQRLHAASEHSATTEVTKQTTTTTTQPAKPLENAKDALISSIFYVFGTCGENGLSASEVVKYMLEQHLPGLKEGGARHTVQVANVLRSSASFISLGDKRYLLCSSLDSSRSAKPPSTRQPQLAPKASPASSTPASPISRGSPVSDYDDGKRDSSWESEDVSPQQKPRSRSNVKNSRSNRKPIKAPVVVVQDVRIPSVVDPVVVKTTRRRGPSSSQKGKGPTQCKRYDGRGWQCSRLTEPGYSLCVHHQDLINKRAAKLKEQQTLSRLMESQHRKLAKTPQQQPPPQEAPHIEPAKLGSDGIAPLKQSSRENSSPGVPPVQKRKMLSLLAIK